MVKRNNWFDKILMFSFIGGMALVLSFIAFMIAMALAFPLFNIPLDQMGKLDQLIIDTTNPGLIKYVQSIQFVTLFILPSLIIATVYRGGEPDSTWLLQLFSRDKSQVDEQKAPLERGVFGRLQIKRPPSWKSAALVILIIIVGGPLINFTAELNAKLQLPAFLQETQARFVEMENQAMEIYKALLTGESVSLLLLNLLVMAILPALGEEMLFRGILQRFLVKMTTNAHVGIVITALLFSFFHMQFLTFLPRVLLGLFLGYSFYWSRSLWIPVIAHFANNAIIVIYTYFAGAGSTSELENIGTTGMMGWLTVISLVLVAFLVWLLYREEKSRPDN